MAVVQSIAGLVDLQPNWTSTASYGSLAMYDSYSYAYSYLYRTQPNVRTCVDFIARNVAQIGLHTFRRLSETDRQRLRDLDHGMAWTLAHPNPWTTPYRLIEGMVADFGVFFNAYWWKVKGVDGRVQLVPLRPEMVAVYGDLLPTGYDVGFETQTKHLDPGELVHFRGYNPANRTVGLSPLETLRRVLAEEFATGEYREHFWKNAARQSAVIERPLDAPEWSPTSRARYTAEFEAMYSGGANSGKTIVLEEGMKLNKNSFSAQESEYLQGRKLTREECARAYHIPLPMVGILDNANFANMREAHKQLYQDCLGPILAMIEDEIDLQLLPEFPNSDGVYVEFNIQEKLSGSFEEQAQSFQSAVGRPWMTPDEARARLNMPSLGGDADQLATPLNVLIGGQASPRDSAPKGLLLGTKAAEGDIDPTLPELRGRHMEKWAEVLSRFFGRQQSAIIGRVREGAGIETVWSDGERWDGELSADLLRLSSATALVWARYMAEQMDIELDEARMESYLAASASNAAVAINATTHNQVATALSDEVPKDAVKRLFEIAAGSRAREISRSRVTSMANFGAHEGAKQAGLSKKTWQVNSGNPRDDHAAMNGMTIGIGELFPTGQRWPGDPAGGAAEVANCKCSIRFSR